MITRSFPFYKKIICYFIGHDLETPPDRPGKYIHCQRCNKDCHSQVLGEILDTNLKSFPYEKAYGLRWHFKFMKWGIEIWERGWLE